MKIAVWHNLPSGGGKRALYYFVRGLVERGHKLACWSLDTADHSYLPLSEFVSERIIPSEANGGTRKSFTDKWRPNVNKAVDRMRAFDQACRRCAREIEAGDFDVLFANSALHYCVPYIMRHLRMKKVLYLQEPSRYLYEASPILPGCLMLPKSWTKQTSSAPAASSRITRACRLCGYRRNKSGSTLSPAIKSSSIHISAVKVFS